VTGKCIIAIHGLLHVSPSKRNPCGAIGFRWSIHEHRCGGSLGRWSDLDSIGFAPNCIRRAWEDQCRRDTSGNGEAVAGIKLSSLDNTDIEGVLTSRREYSTHPMTSARRGLGHRVNCHPQHH
jgi:hypothetical protein